MHSIRSPPLTWQRRTAANGCRSWAIDRTLQSEGSGRPLTFGLTWRTPAVPASSFLHHSRACECWRSCLRFPYRVRLRIVLSCTRGTCLTKKSRNTKRRREKRNDVGREFMETKKHERNCEDKEFRTNLGRRPRHLTQKQHAEQLKKTEHSSCRSENRRSPSLPAFDMHLERYRGNVA